MFDQVFSYEDFEAGVARTWRSDWQPLTVQEIQLCNAAMGLAGEAGEAADYLKKSIFHGKPLDLDHAKKELGDVLYYTAITGRILGVSLRDIAWTNNQKLAARYPEGFVKGGGIR